MQASDLLGTIASEMKQRFPDAPPPRLNGSPQDIITYAYLAANVAFRYPYDPDAGPFPFYEDGRDPPVMVKGFGFARHHGAPPHRNWIRQVGVLFVKNMGSIEESAPPQFVLDLDQTSTPYQLLLARIAPETTLGATIHEMEAHIAAYAAEREQPDTITGDELYVPFLDWRVKHRFHELEGSDKAFQNPGFEGFHIDEAHQMVDFQLDQGGARLTSEAVIHVRSGPRRFAFESPFLVLLRVRGEKLPFFVTWIQNAELLTKP